MSSTVTASELIETDGFALTCGDEGIVHPARKKSGPDFLEIMLLAIVGSLVFASTILLFSRYGAAVQSFGDSSAYESVASALQRWNFEGLQVKQSWGYPYAMAGVAIVAGLSTQSSLLLVSWISCFVSIALAYRKSHRLRYSLCRRWRLKQGIAKKP